jgi:hypothetical protein
MLHTFLDSPVITSSLSEDLRLGQVLSARDRFAALANNSELFKSAGSKRLLKDYAEANHPSSSVRLCERMLIPGKDVKLSHYEGSTYSYSGVVKCGSVLCPCCRKAKLTKRAEQIEKGLLGAHKGGYKVFFVTLTSSRNACPFKLIDLHNACINRVFTNFRSLLSRTGIDRSTFGSAIGWDVTLKPGSSYPIHQHYHLVVAFEDQDHLLSDDFVSSWFVNTWMDQINRYGKRLGVDAVRAGQDATRVWDGSEAALARYLTKRTKLGFEVAYGGSKSSFNGLSLDEFLLLAAHEPENKELVKLYQRIAYLLKGRQLVRLNGSLKRFADEFDGELKPKKALLNTISFSPNLYQAILNTGLKYVIGDLMVAYWEKGTSQKSAELVISLAALSIKREHTVGYFEAFLRLALPQFFQPGAPGRLVA